MIPLQTKHLELQWLFVPDFASTIDINILSWNVLLLWKPVSLGSKSKFLQDLPGSTYYILIYTVHPSNLRSFNYNLVIAGSQ